jgi:competence protein ComEC
MKWQRTHRSELLLTCLDVGHGQAILARLPGTTNLLFDAGSLYGKDVGSRIVIPCLDYLGLGRLHAIIASHHDLDHINGIPEIVGFRRVERIYLGGAFFAAAPVSETTELLTRHLEERGIDVEPVPPTMSAGVAQVHVLWPTADSAINGKRNENDNSLVCLLEFAGRRVLLCSDIEKPAQQEIMVRYAALKAEVVVAPHHGSTRTLDNRFLAHTRPDILLCSCARRDYEQGRIVRPAADQSTAWLVTARDGAIDVGIDRDGRITAAPLTPEALREPPSR